MKVVVTGGSGFIGDHVVKELRNQGHEPVILDRHTGLDVRSKYDVHRAMKGAEGVIHLAGILGTEELFHEPRHAIQINIEGATNVILAALDEGAVFVNITMPHVWNNIYQATKQCVEHIATAYWQHYGLRVCKVRAFNVFGEGQKVGSPQKIIPTFSNCGWMSVPMPIWGDGGQHVDLIHVGDAARMLVEALRFSDNRVLDAGTGQPVSVNTIADAVKELTGSKEAHEYLPMRKGEHTADVVSKGEGWADLDWRPLFSWDDLVRTVESYRLV